MITEIYQNNLYLKYINDIIGWGVYTNNDIKNGETVEICYCLLEKFSKSQHQEYAFLRNEFDDDSYLVLGFGMIYNHSNEPNIKWEIIDYNNRIIRFSAIKNISTGEQLCHNYGERYWRTIPKKIKTIL